MMKHSELIDHLIKAWQVQLFKDIWNLDALSFSHVYMKLIVVIIQNFFVTLRSSMKWLEGFLSNKVCLVISVVLYC